MDDRYNAMRKPPAEIIKPIEAGNLKGKSDINPQWRVEIMTEQFGLCGIGWKYVITDKRLEQGANGEMSAFLDIDLFVKVDGAWSEAIPGTGGSAFVAREKGGLYTSDECFKMALTDAISVACKALGFGADVYWEADRSKYDKPAPVTYSKGEVICESCGIPIKGVTCQGIRYSPDDIADKSIDRYGKRLCWGCMKAANAAEKNHAADNG